MNIDPSVPKEHGNVQYGHNKPVPQPPPSLGRILFMAWGVLTLALGLLVEIDTIADLFKSL